MFQCRSKFFKSRQINIEVVIRRWLFLAKKCQKEEKKDECPEKKQEEEAKKRHPLVTTCELTKVSPKPEFDPGWPQPRIVIVGAGIAGLSAANRLLDHGMNNLVILEALDRPGGRIHTCDMNGTKVNLGADHILGGSVANTMFNLACMEGVVDRASKPIMIEKGPYYTMDGRILYDIEVAYKILKSILDDAVSIFGGKFKNKTSLLSFITPRVKSAVAELPDSDQSEIVYVINGMISYLRTRWGDDLAQLSTEYLGSYICLPGGIVELSQGACNLVKALLPPVEKFIQYRKPVQSMRWNSFPMDCVPRGSALCCDGEEFHCDFLLCTVPLGVLKEQAATIFSPPLTQDKMDAIQRIGWGHLNKIFLAYDKPFWSREEGLLKVAWNQDELRHRDDWTKGIGLIEEVQGANILCTTVAGREATWSESCDDRHVAEDLTNFIRKVTNNPAIPCPITVLRSRWSSNVYFSGAKSYMGLESSVQDQCILASPLPDGKCPSAPILLFAGEATAPGHLSTMHGARISGLREADRILRICQKYEGPPYESEEIKLLRQRFLEEKEEAPYHSEEPEGDAEPDTGSIPVDTLGHTGTILEKDYLQTWDVTRDVVIVISL